MQLSFDIQGEQALSRRLRITSERVKNWTPAFKDTAIKLKDVFSNESFRTKGAVIGKPWSPLSRAYAARKAKLYPNKNTLEARGRMRQSFQTLWKADMAQVWNTAPYFAYHQSNKPRAKLPRRAMMWLAERQRQQVVKIFHTYFRKITQP